MFCTHWPIFTCGQVTTPLVYTEDLSIAQQIAHIFGAIKQLQDSLKNYLTIQQYNDFLQWLDDELAAQLATANGYTDSAIANLEGRIDAKLTEIGKNSLQWNVSIGAYDSSPQSQHDMFADVTIHAYTIVEFAGLSFTVGDVADCGLNCRGFAAANTWLTQGFGLTSFYLWPQLDDITKLYTYQDIQDMGITPQPAEPDADYLVTDLANSAVRTSGNVYVTIKEV